MRMVDSWRRRTGPERFETYTRWTLYLLLGFVPLLAASVIGTTELDEERVVAFTAYAGLVTLEAGLAILVIRQGVTAFRDSTPLPRGPVVLLLAVAGAAVVAAMLGLPPAADMGWAGRGGAVLVALATCLFAVTPVLTSPVLLPLALAASAVAALANRPAMDWPLVVPTFMLFGVVMVAITPSFRISVWMLGVVWEQERTRQLHARLAVAEERLRFSRDLHDVVGRALSAIALKSELGAELSRRGQGERAAEQMLEVRELAGDSLREVRAVVAGYRQADLATEVAGARSVLRSAGVRTRVIGEDTALPPRVQSALAWVVREGATNVVRHSAATTCTIDVAVVEEGGQRLGQLTVVNDGVTGPPSTGSGLVGLSERLSGLGGTVTTESSGGSFTLRARVPLGRGDVDAGGGTMGAP
ncbi:two-component system, NarL family, sensor histidine kinase DesK [Georgenia satyanarayanai]|uniref:Two-component system, NarL family, sensor histidine kinase DesK n=1 Tax=Georgenia satyanarayanai TaxID=860221 RepID=A0A2Y9AWX1_9MICO|nr:sensor histidine kinase [Georgenia satyanarayanai]PYF96315.1 two-component system sensor histidine kinase DesK [Georgenia satyanarayanai]SSA47037.1 two-component system, NarL family, sensor histidine kinase DesK [Georgenia satyanarayanai]